MNDAVDHNNLNFYWLFQETAEEKLIVNDLKSVYHYVKSAGVCATNSNMYVSSNFCAKLLIAVLHPRDFFKCKCT